MGKVIRAREIKKSMKMYFLVLFLFPFVNHHSYSKKSKEDKVLVLFVSRLTRKSTTLHCGVLYRRMALQARPPPGYSSLPVSSSQILLPLTISNKCGQSFRWRRVEVYDNISLETNQVKIQESSIIRVKKEDESYTPLVQTSSKSIYRKTIEWSICLADRVVFVRQDEERDFIYHKTIVAKHTEAAVEAGILEETATWLEDYLNLRVPLAELYQEWSEKDEVFKRFAKRFTGVRMLRQDPWECVCA